MHAVIHDEAVHLVTFAQRRVATNLSAMTIAACVSDRRQCFSYHRQLAVLQHINNFRCTKITSAKSLRSKGAVEQVEYWPQVKVGCLS